MSQAGTGFDLLARAAAGDPGAVREATAWLMRGLRTWFRARGSISLERALGLPSIKSARRAFMVTSRDYWICVAHGLCAGSTPWAKSVTLAQEVERYITHIWPSWKDLTEPPPGSSQLRTALFNAMQVACEMPTARDMPAMPTTARQFHEIVKRKAAATSQQGVETEVSMSPESKKMTTTPTPEQKLAMDILSAWRDDPAVRAEFKNIGAYAAYREGQALKPADEVTL